jgi:hypothetical protein
VDLQDLFFRLAYCSTYRSANSPNVTDPLSALLSATGSLPLATSTMTSAAIVRASSTPIAASPMWYQRGFPPREYTNFHAFCLVGWTRRASPRWYVSHTANASVSGLIVRTDRSVSLCLRAARAGVPSLFDLGMGETPINVR